MDTEALTAQIRQDNPHLSDEGVALALNKYAETPIRPPDRQAPPTYVSSSQVLAEDHPALTTGYNTLMEQLGAGAEKIASIVPGAKADPNYTPLRSLAGVAQVVGAPATAVGETMGTATHNFLAEHIPADLLAERYKKSGVVLGGPSGILPAAGATLANMAGQFATGYGEAKVGAGLLNLLSKAPGKEKLIGNVAESLGQPATIGERALTTDEALNLLYQTARAEGKPVPTANIVDKVGNILKAERKAVGSSSKVTGKLNPDGSWSGGLLEDVVRKFETDPNTSYEYAITTEQRLGRLARDMLKGDNPDSNSAVVVNQAKNAILDAMDAVSPSIKAANVAYRKARAASDVFEALYSADPGRQTKLLFNSDHGLAKSLGFTKPEDVNNLVQRAEVIGDTAANPISKVRAFAGAVAALVGTGYMAHYVISRYLYGLMKGG